MAVAGGRERAMHSHGSVGVWGLGKGSGTSAPAAVCTGSRAFRCPSEPEFPLLSPETFSKACPRKRTRTRLAVRSFLERWTRGCARAGGWAGNWEVGGDSSSDSSSDSDSFLVSDKLSACTTRATVSADASHAEREGDGRGRGGDEQRRERGGTWGWERGVALQRRPCFAPGRAPSAFLPRPLASSETYAILSRLLPKGGASSPADTRAGVLWLWRAEESVR